MITLFTTPKAFRGPAAVHQRNAIRSWTLLEGRPEVLLLGDEEGTGEVAEELGVRHISGLKGNGFGTPLVRSVFEHGQRNAHDPVVCYINADVILFDDFVSAISKIHTWSRGQSFLLVGRRWNLEVNEPLDFGDPSWRRKLQARLTAEGYQESPAATEYFAFPQATEWHIPPFAIGRGAWDGWLLHNTRVMGVAVIDASAVVTAVHQQHDYSHWHGGGTRYVQSEEYKTNRRLRGSILRQFTIWDATHLLTPGGGVVPAPPGRKISATGLRFRMFAEDCLRAGEPYTTPLIFVLRSLRKRARVRGGLRA